VSTRDRTRDRLLRRGALIALVLVVLTLLFLVTGHWILAIVAAIPAAIAVWLYLQARSVR